MGFIDAFKKKSAARKSGLTYAQYQEFLEINQKRHMTVETYRLYLVVRGLGLDDNDCMTYLDSFRDTYSPEEYKKLLSAQKLNMELDQYDEYERFYSHEMSPKEYLHFDEARKIGLTVDEYDGYTAEYQKVYAPQRFHEFFIARECGLSLQQYDEWFAEHQDLPLSRFAEFNVAREMGISLESYDLYAEATKAGMPQSKLTDILSAKNGNEQYVITDLAEIKIANSLGVKRVIVDSSVCQLPHFAFKNCVSFEEVVLSWGILEVGAYLFEGCLALKNIVFPGSIRTIPNGVLKGCNQLESIQILYGIESVDITGWEDLPSLTSVMSAGSVREFVYSHQKNNRYHLCDGSFESESEMRERKSTLKVIEYSGSKYSTTYGSSHGPYVMLDGYQSLEVLLITTHDLYGLSVKNCPALKVIVVNGINGDSIEYYKNGNIKKTSSRPKDLYISETIPNLKFMLIKSSVQSVVVYDRCPSLTWLHVPSETVNVKAPTLKAIMTSSACEVPDSLIVWGHNPPDSSKKNIPFLMKNCKHQQQTLDIISYKDCEIGRYSHNRSLLSNIDADTIEIMEGTKTVGAKSFRGYRMGKLCLPRSLSEIHEKAFQSCINLKAMHIPKVPTHVALDAFNGCELPISITGSNVLDVRLRLNLPKVSIASVAALDFTNYQTAIPDQIFSGSGVTELRIPKSVLTIGKRAFADSKKLKKIVFEGVPERIAHDAFEGCTSVQSLEFGGCIPLNIAGDSGFPKVQRLTLSDSYKEIPSHCFRKWGLTSIIIPSTIEKIGSGAFLNCKNLESIIFEGKPTMIAPDAFEGCKSVQTIEFGDSEIFNIAGKTGFPHLTEFSVPSGTTEIPENSFRNWGLQSVTLPDTVTTIGANAFLNCSKLTRINDPENGTLVVSDTLEIGKDAFKGCIGIQKVVLDCSRIETKMAVVSQCKATNIVIRDSVSARDLKLLLQISGLKSIKCIEIGVKVQLSASITLPTCPKSIEYLSLPNCIQSISNHSLKMCKSLKVLTLSENTLVVSQDAFKDCSALRELTLPSDTFALLHPNTIRKKVKLTVVGEGHEDKYSITATGFQASLPRLSLRDKLLIRKITIASESIGIDEKAFTGLLNLKEVEILGSITSVGSSAFSGCLSLHEITLPDSVNSIGASAFKGCSSLTKIRLPNALERICEDTFSGCTKLSEVSNMKKVGYIENNAFNDCESLFELVFSNEIFSIHDAFIGCKSLKKFVVPTDIAVFRTDLSTCTSLESLYLPQKVDEFSCKTATENKISVYARRGSSWRNLLDAHSVIYLKNEDYHSKIQEELLHAGLLDDELSGSTAVKVQANTLPPSVANATAKPKRASWSAHSRIAENFESFSNGPESIDKMFEKMRTEEISENYSVEGVVRNQGKGSFKESVAFTSGFKCANEDRVITNSIFSIEFVKDADSQAEDFYVIALDSDGLSVSNMKHVRITSSNMDEVVVVQLELSKGAVDGMVYLITARSNPIEGSILSIDEFTVDVSFSPDPDFDL